jgi:hypothetical protein
MERFDVFNNKIIWYDNDNFIMMEWWYINWLIDKETVYDYIINNIIYFLTDK